MSLLARVRDIAAREPGRPALRAGGRALAYGALVDAIARRAEDLEGDSLIRLDGADPAGFVIDFFAARARGLRAIAFPASAPAALSRMRETAVREAPWPAGGATVFFSSGSVGASKAVPLSESNLLAAALAFEPWGDVTRADRIAVGLSPAQIFAFVRGALNSLLVGAEAVFFAPRRDPLREAADLGATAVLLPSALVGLAARHTSRPPLRALQCGGGVLAEAAAQAVEGVRGVPVRVGYGMTESAGLAARQPVDRPRRAGSSGLPAPGIDIAIVSESGRACRAGEPGEIRLAGPAVFSGYLLPEDPAPFDAEGRLRTGDVGFLDASGELRVQGRLAFSLSAGDRILCAEEVEAAIAEHPSVADVAAAPVDRTFGVLVVARAGAALEFGEIRAHVAQRLPAFARPRRILGVAELPRTAGGKIDRLAASRWLSEDPING